jgi:hypothetical protein
MAKIYVTEFTSLGTAQNGSPQIAARPAVARQSMAITASSTSLPTPFTAQTKYIRVHTDAICSIAISKTPTADVTYDRLPADSTEYFGVSAGDNLAVIANT